MWPRVFVLVGREGRGDSLSPEWHTLYRRRAGPLPSVCTAGLLPAFQPRAGHFCLVNTHTLMSLNILLTLLDFDY